MDKLGELAGAVASYAIVNIYGGETLIPLLGSYQDDGTIKFSRITGSEFDNERMFEKGYTGDLNSAIEHGLDLLKSNPDTSPYNALVFERAVEAGSGTFDNLYCIGVKYGEAPAQVDILFPYQKKANGKEFELFMPNPFHLDPEDLDVDAVMNGFLSGLKTDSKGWGILQGHFNNNHHPTIKINKENEMKSVLSMAGNYASHAIWSVSSGETLIPIVGFLKSDGEHHMERLAMGSAQAASAGEKKINNLTDEYKGAVFIKDGIVTLETGKTDCLIIDVKFTDDASKKIQFLIPYRNANHENGFVVHRLKITENSGFSSEDMEWISDAFFNGLEAHPEGGRIWSEKYEDQAGVSTGYYGEQNTEFSVEDFEKLKKAPFLIFFLVAAADGKVDKKEITEFMKVLSSPDCLSDPLFNRIITNVITEIPTIISEMATKQLNYIVELGLLKDISDSNLSEEESNKFKISLFLLGKHIAEASGGFFGFGSKISKEEKTALAAIAVCLGITV